MNCDVCGKPVRYKEACKTGRCYDCGAWFGAIKLEFYQKAPALWRKLRSMGAL